MSDFSDRPYAAGSLTGLRAFDIDGQGRLLGPTYPAVFGPGVNDAVCIDYHSMIVQQLNAAFEQLYRIIPGGRAAPVVLRSSPRSTHAGHVTGGQHCTCGFYAYTDGSNTYARPSRVTAIVEGFGVCTVGSRGFRASKARLVAFVDPTHKVRTHTLISAAGLAWCAVLATVDVLGGEWLWAGLMGGLALFNGFELVLSIRQWRRLRFKLVRRQYPGVPVYRTQKRALRAHPLTVREAKGGASS